MKPRVLVCISLEASEARRLAEDGPRRDLLVLAERLGADILYAPGGRRKGLRARIAGPHVTQAFRAAHAANRYDAVLADGEHIGVPLLVAALVLRRKARISMLGHYLSKPWKRALLRAATQAHSSGSVIVHSTRQRDAARSAVRPGWDVDLQPYQVDTAYWRPSSEGSTHEPGEPPLFVAVGAENRDYATLVAAAAGLPVRVVIAGGSHWAREAATVPETAANVEHVPETLSFASLRVLYSRAAAVVVPLNPVENQSGVTTILEAMSMGLPVIVTATPGQREVVSGPLVTAGGIDAEATANRGPAAFGSMGTNATGFYVPPGDPTALRRALMLLAEDPGLRQRLGDEGARVAQQLFDVDQFAERLAAGLVPHSNPTPIIAQEPA